jgi:hypothetical protein
LQNTGIKLMMLSIGVLHSLGHFMVESLSLLRIFLTFFIRFFFMGEELTRWERTRKIMFLDFSPS